MNYQIKVNDLEPALKVQILGLDLTGCTVAFVMRLNSAAQVKVNAPAVIDNAPTGKVSYAWSAGDTDTPGKYRAEWVITYSNGRKRTVPAGGYDTVEVIANLE